MAVMFYWGLKAFVYWFINKWINNCEKRFKTKAKLLEERQWVFLIYSRQNPRQNTGKKRVLASVFWRHLFVACLRLTLCLWGQRREQKVAALLTALQLATNPSLNPHPSYFLHFHTVEDKTVTAAYDYGECSLFLFFNCTLSFSHNFAISNVSGSLIQIPRNATTHLKNQIVSEFLASFPTTDLGTNKNWSACKDNKSICPLQPLLEASWTKKNFYLTRAEAMMAAWEFSVT